MHDVKRQLRFHLVMLWRRRWLALGIAWPICLVGWIFVALMPNTYLATARIYVDTDTLLAPLLKGIAIDADMKQQVDVMQRTLLSRPNLQKVLHSTDLNLIARAPEDEDRLLKQLGTAVIRPQVVHNLFTVEYADNNAVLARSVVQALLNIFVESNLGSSRRDMNEAQRFIEERIKDYERQLRESEQRLADFKRANPELTRGDSNFATRFETSKQRLVDLKSQLDDALTRRVALQAQIKQVPQFLEVDAAAQVVIENGGRHLTDLEARIAQVRKSLDDLSLRYTDQHPDVIAAKRMLEDLLKQQKVNGPGPAVGSGSTHTAGGSRAPAKQKIPNNVYEQLQIKLVEVDSDVSTLQRRLAEQQAEVDRIGALSRNAPTIEANFASLNRDYGVLHKSYDELLSRRESAKMSSSVDNDSQKVQFRIIDPPETPIIPIAPNRPLLISIALIAGVGVGCAAALLLGHLDDCFGTVQSLRGAFSLPVLGSISVAPAASRSQRRIVPGAAFAMTGLALFLTYSGALFGQIYRAPIIDFLHPLIQPLRQFI